MLLGVMTGAHDSVCVQDFGIDNVTAADGLACGRPSAFVGRRMQQLIDAFYTVTDADMYRLVALLARIEDLRIEPSSATAFAGIKHLTSNKARDYRQRTGLTRTMLAHATHLAWVTGGSMVPAEEMDGYIEKGRSLL